MNVLCLVNWGRFRLYPGSEAAHDTTLRRSRERLQHMSDAELITFGKHAKSLAEWDKRERD